MSLDLALVERARGVAGDVLAGNADRVDTEAHFPRENLAALHRAGLMAVFLAPELGGHRASIRTYSAIAAALAEHCTSTAMLWAMHGQQLISLHDHAADSHQPWLRRAGDEGCIIGSVTTDDTGGADLFVTGDPLLIEGAMLRVRRTAPVVTAGANAGFYLVSMRDGPDVPLTQTSLVCVEHADGEIVERGRWDAMGMRGTHSVPMLFDALVEPSRVLATPLSEIAKLTLVPVGHVGWASCWLGTARGAVNRVRDAVRRRSIRATTTRSDLLFSRLAELRLKLDLLDSLITRVATEADEARSARGRQQPADQLDPVLVNNLKLAGSRLAFAILDELIELVGMREGYLRHGALGLERAFRDLRSAPLMFHNDRLLQTNGRLVLAGGRGLIGLGDRDASANGSSPVPAPRP
ncbi:MAG: acyl-CoA dehydrogenase family protein [Jatrophihabitans sp.]